MINEARAWNIFSGWKRPSRSSTGTSGAPACHCAEFERSELSRGADGRRHGVAAGAASRPIRWQDIRRRVLLRRDVRRARRRAAPGPRGGTGRGGHGHRHPRRREPHLRLRAQHRPPTRQPARGPAAGDDRPAPAPGREAVHHPGPLGGQLRRRHRQRELQQPARARCSAAWSARPTTRSQTSSAPFVASPRLRPRCCPNSPPPTSCAPCPASTCPSSSPRAGSTRWRPAKPPSGSTTH